MKIITTMTNTQRWICHEYNEAYSSGSVSYMNLLKACTSGKIFKSSVIIATLRTLFLPYMNFPSIMLPLYHDWVLATGITGIQLRGNCVGDTHSLSLVGFS